MIRTYGEVNSGFVAGFLEGDGSIGCAIVKGKNGDFFRPIVSFSNNDKEILIKIEKFLGKGCWYTLKYKENYISPTHYLRYDSQVRVLSILEKLNGEWLSRYRRKQLKPILNYLGTRITFQSNLNKNWVRGFVFAEGWVHDAQYIIKEKRYVYRTYGVAQKNQEVLMKVRNWLIKEKVVSYKNPTSIVIQRRGDVKKFERLLDVIEGEYNEN